MKTVKQVSELTGISIRTLHYYDEIGLLKPSAVTEAGYRMYNQEALLKLQQILFFRELDFELKEIKEMLDNPNFNREKALKKQRKLLKLKKARMNSLISLIDKALEGKKFMSFQEFDQSEIEQYKEETKRCWGDPPAFQESEKKAEKYSKKQLKKINEAAEEIFLAFASRMDQDVSDPEVKALVKRWKDHIRQYYDPCTEDILRDLSQRYRNDARLTKNIDKYQKGLAEFMNKAILAYLDS